jgi:hypothetical protein
MEGDAVGNSLSGLTQTCRRCNDFVALICSWRVDEVRAFQANRTLKELRLTCSCLIVDALIGNTSIKILYVGYNERTSRGLDDIMRILETTQLESIGLGSNRGLFSGEDSTRRFAVHSLDMAV